MTATLPGTVEILNRLNVEFVMTLPASSYSGAYRTANPPLLSPWGRVGRAGYHERTSAPFTTRVAREHSIPASGRQKNRVPLATPHTVTLVPLLSLATAVP